MVSEAYQSRDIYWPRKEYNQLYRRSLDDPEGFWDEQARKLDWYRSWDKVLEWKAPYAQVVRWWGA